MTLGPQPVDVHRIAGIAAAWAGFVDVKAGDPLPRFEIIRASVGYPVVWQWYVFFDGGGAGALANPATVLVSPGLGRGGSAHGQPLGLKSPAPTVAPGTGTPATELIVTVETTELAAKDYRVCAVCAPIFWLPLLGPQG